MPVRSDVQIVSPISTNSCRETATPLLYCCYILWSSGPSRPIQFGIFIYQQQQQHNITTTPSQSKSGSDVV